MSHHVLRVERPKEVLQTRFPRKHRAEKQRVALDLKPLVVLHVVVPVRRQLLRVGGKELARRVAAVAAYVHANERSLLSEGSPPHPWQWAHSLLPAEHQLICRRG